MTTSSASSASALLVATLGLLGLLVAACDGAGGGLGGGVASADCAAQVRWEAQVFTGRGTTRAAATDLGAAELAECHDSGERGDVIPGSVFPADPDLVEVWAIDGHDPDQVLGVRFDRGSLTVFVADSVAEDDARRILADLRVRAVALVRSSASSEARRS